MADPDFGADLVSDLNGSRDSTAIPYGGDQVPQNQQPSSTPSDTSAPAGDPEPSLREELAKAFKQHGEPGAAPVAPPAPQTAQSPQGQAPAAAPPAQAPAPQDSLIKVGERWHKRDGTFASQAEIEAFNAASAQPAADPNTPPPLPPYFANQLTPVEQQQFTALPPEIRQFVERTVEGVNQRAQQLQEYETIEREIMGPRRQAWASQGMSPTVALNGLLNLSDFAGRDPAQFVLWFSGQHNLDLDQILDDRDAQQQPQDPRYTGLQKEIASLRDTIQGFSSRTVQQEQAGNLKLVQDFAAEKDASGGLKYPFFAEVANEMMPHIQALRANQPLLPGPDILKAAYDFACYQNLSVRSRMQEATSAASKAAAAAEAEKARRAGASVSGAPNGDARKNAPSNSPSRSVRDDIMEAINQHTS